MNVMVRIDVDDLCGNELPRCEIDMELRLNGIERIQNQIVLVHRQNSISFSDQLLISRLHFIFNDILSETLLSVNTISRVFTQ